MKRSEQDIRFQWDLTKIYPDTAAWEAAMQEAEAALAPLAAIPGTLGTSKEAFKKGLDTIYASMFKVELPYTYAFLKKTEDGSVAENQEMAARSESLLVKFSAATAFLNPEILAIPAEKLDAWMQDEALATYRHTVDDIVRMRAHTLDAAREQMLALLGMLTLAGFVIFMEFSMFSAFEMLNAPEMLPGLAILLAMVTALLFSVFQMLAALYFSRDTASMAYLPLTSRTVLAAKWTEVYVSELLFSLLIAAPAVVLYGIHYAADWTYYLRMVPVLLAVNCIPLTISLLLASILGRFTSLTRHKEVWVVLGTVLMLVVVLGLEWSILPKIPEDADAAFFAQMLTGVQPMLRAFIHAFPPVAWAVDGIAGDWLQWLAFLAVSIGGAALVIALVGGSYLDTTLRQNEGSRKARRVRVTDKTFRAHSPFMAIYRREWNEILKVPVYLLNGVLGAMMLPIMLIGMSVGMSSEQDSEVSWNFLLRLMQDSVSLMDVMLILTALLMFISWVNPIIATAISREGGRMPIAKYIPVSPRTQLWAKLSVSLTINGAAILLMGIAVAALLGTHYLGAVLGAVVLANLFSLATGCIALTIDASRPILHWQTEQQVMKQNMNQMICMLVVLLVALIPVAGVVGMMVLSSAAQDMEAPSMLMRFAAEHAIGLRSVVAALLMAAEAGVSILILHKVGEKRFSAIEP